MTAEVFIEEKNSESPGARLLTVNPLMDGKSRFSRVTRQNFSRPPRRGHQKRFDPEMIQGFRQLVDHGGLTRTGKTAEHEEGI